MIYHLGAATLSTKNPKKTFLNFRTSLFAVTKNAKGFLFGIIFIRLILDGVAGLKFLMELKPKHTWAVIKAHFSFYSHLKRLLIQRKSIKIKTKYYQKTSIVYDYFVNRKTKYKNL